jgi:hypothetical protein
MAQPIPIYPISNRSNKPIVDVTYNVITIANFQNGKIGSMIENT